jgi:hypothetical protein
MNMSVQEPAAPRPASSPPNLALLVSLFEPLQQRQPLFSTAHVEPGQFWYFTTRLVQCLHTRSKRSKVCKHRDSSIRRIMGNINTLPSGVGLGDATTALTPRRYDISVRTMLHPDSPIRGTPK